MTYAGRAVLRVVVEDVVSIQEVGGHKHSVPEEGGRRKGGRKGGRGRNEGGGKDRGDQKGGQKYNPAVWRYATTEQHSYCPVVTWYLLIQQNETSLHIFQLPHIQYCSHKCKLAYHTSHTWQVNELPGILQLDHHS